MMSKYSSLYGDIYSIFGTVAWKAEAIPTFPENFVGTVASNEYIRVSILSGEQNLVNIPRSVSGQVIIDIFIPAGGGPQRIAQIADKLDAYLAGRSIRLTGSGNTQFGASVLANGAVDKANAALYRASYSIPFNYFGV